MRRLVTWLAVSGGIAALLRRLRRPTAVAPAVTPSPPTVPPAPHPADELRAKLAATRSPATEATGAVPEESVEERRAQVHAEGRAAAEEMRSDSER